MWILCNPTFPLKPSIHSSCAPKLINLETRQEKDINILSVLTGRLDDLEPSEKYQYRYEVIDAKQRLIIVNVRHQWRKPKHSFHCRSFNFLVRLTEHNEFEIIERLSNWLSQLNTHTPNFIINADSENPHVTIIDRRSWKVKKVFVKTLEKGYLFNTLWQDKDELRVLIQHSGILQDGKEEWDLDRTAHHALKKFDTVVYSLARLMHDNFNPVSISSEKFSRNDFPKQLLQVDSLPFMEGNRFRMTFRGLNHLYLALNDATDDNAYNESDTEIIQLASKLVCSIFSHKSKQSYLCHMNRTTMAIESKTSHNQQTEQEYYLLYEDEHDNLIVQNALSMEILSRTKTFDQSTYGTYFSTVGIVF